MIISDDTLALRVGPARGRSLMPSLTFAADKRGADLWVGALDRSTATSPLELVLEGLVLAVNSDATPEQMANSVAMLQLDLADPDFHGETLRGARAVRARIGRDLSAALTTGELRSGTDVATLAKLVETPYHGAMIGWAIHREVFGLRVVTNETGPARNEFFADLTRRWTCHLLAAPQSLLAPAIAVRVLRSAA